MYPFPPHTVIHQDEVNTNRIRLGEMQDEHTRLVQQQEVLQAELQVALDSYQPKAVIGTGV